MAEPAVVPAPRPTRVRYGVMAFLLVLSFLTYFDRVCIMRVQHEIRAELKFDREHMGLVFGAFWLAYALFDVPAGWLGDRFGARLALTRVVLAWSLFTALTGCATGLVTLLAYRFLFGVGEAGAYPNMGRVQSAWLSPAARAQAGGWLWLAARWGGAFSPYLFAAILRLIGTEPSEGQPSVVPWLWGVSSWRAGFWIAGLLGVVWCAAFFPWFRNDPADHPGVNEAELAVIRSGRTTGETGGHGRLDPGVWRALLTSGSLWALTAYYVFSSFGWSFFVSWMPDYLLAEHGVEFDASESIWKQPLLYGGVSCLVGGVLSDWLVRRTGRKYLGRALFPLMGMTTAATAIYCVRFVKDPDYVIALLCLAGAAHDFGQGANWASIVDIGGRYAGVATGLINLGNIGNVFQPYIGARIVALYDWNTLFTVLACSLLLAASMWMFIEPRRRFYDPVARPQAAHG